MQQSCHKISLVLISLVFVILFNGGGCGGGTRGSGGQLFEGVVSDSSSRSLSGVSVTILLTGDSAVTDENGSFVIATADVSGGVEFLLESPQFSGKVVTQNIPADAARVFVSFIVGSGTKPTITSDIEIKEREPKPTAAPRSTATPLATSTPANGLPAPTPTSIPVTGGSGSTGGGDDSGDDKGDDNSGDDKGGSGNSGSGSSGSNGSGSNGSGSGDDSSSGGSGSNGGSGSGGSSSGGGSLKEGEGVDSEGEISAISGSTITVGSQVFVAVPSTEFLGKKGEKLSLANFSVGERVKAKGKVRSGVVELEKIEKK